MIKLPEQPDIEVDPIIQIMNGLEKGLLLMAALKYDLFSILKNGRQTAEEIASKTDTNPGFMGTILNTLVSAGLLTKKDSTFSNTPLAATYLVKESPFFQGTLLDYWYDKEIQWRWNNLPQIIKEGPIQKKGRIEGVKNWFDKRFTYAMAESEIGAKGGLYAAVKALSSLPEFQKAKRLLDAGGGHGLHSIGFAQENPNLQAFVFDLPPVIEITREFIKKYQMEDRVHTIEGDFYSNDLGNNYDIVFGSHAFYRERELLLPVLLKIKNSLNKNGLFISKQWVINKERTGPLISAFFELTLAMISGKEGTYLHTLGDFNDILNEAGFEKCQEIDISGPMSPSWIIISKKR